MAPLHVPSLKAKDFSTPSLLLIDGHHSLERVAVDWIALLPLCCLTICTVEFARGI